MNTKIRVAALAVAAALSGTSQAALYDRGGGLIYDSTLNVTWLQNANYGAGSAYDDAAFSGSSSSTTDGAMSWGNAVAWATNLGYYDSVRNVTYTDWRLPTVDPVNGVALNYTYADNGSTDVGYNITSPQSELGYMFYVNLGNPGYKTTTGAYTGCDPNTSTPCLQNVGPFVNLTANRLFWTGTVYTPNLNNAMYFGNHWGNQSYFNVGVGMQAWAVRDGDIANLLPVSLISGPYAITQGQNLLLNGVASYDPDYVADSIAQYAWDLNGDATFDVFGATADVDAATLTGLGLGAGTHTIALRVTDTHGTFADSTASLTIAAIPEPETYAMMLAGLGLVGWRYRKNR